MKELFNKIKKWLKKEEEEKKVHYILALANGDQTVDFEATPKEFKKLFTTMNGIKVFRADNIIIPLSSISYWYIETTEIKKAKEERMKDERQKMNDVFIETVPLKEENKEGAKRRGRPKKSK